mmetsp:Transcript_10023/g.11123  ORF Transcript_10023/g.11123 Transcript_10023/m.11123 type:complete len:100 (+) Transcript_10023:414-713(+)
MQYHVSPRMTGTTPFINTITKYRMFQTLCVVSKQSFRTPGLMKTIAKTNSINKSFEQSTTADKIKKHVLKPEQLFLLRDIAKPVKNKHRRVFAKTIDRL